MEKIRISDCTLKQAGDRLPLSFKEKIELCKLIDRLEVSQIELHPIRRAKADSLLIKSISSAVRQASVAVPVSLTEESVRTTWAALKEAPSARLQVSVPVSSVQMEYLLHMKPAAVLEAVRKTIGYCLDCTGNVEFIAEDAMRADKPFLLKILDAAIQAGAGIISLRDSSGSMLPEETAQFLTGLYDELPSLRNVTLGFSASNVLALADAVAVAAIESGARELKAVSFPTDDISLKNLVRILSARGTELHVSCGVNAAQLNRITGQIENLCRSAGDRTVSANAGYAKQDTEDVLSQHDTREAVQSAAESLGYDLSAEDLNKVWEVFQSVAARKETVSMHELDAIIAAEALQVPPAYTDIQYLINTSNQVGAMAHMKLSFHGKQLEGISVGDGAIDAAFLALEQAIGRHFELDDFQIRSIAEGREAIGETLVKLRSDGKLYSGRGISTDIVGSSILAYVSALNKIVYEEEEA